MSTRCHEKWQSEWTTKRLIDCEGDPKIQEELAIASIQLKSKEQSLSNEEKSVEWKCQSTCCSLNSSKDPNQRDSNLGILIDSILATTIG